MNAHVTLTVRFAAKILFVAFPAQAAVAQDVWIPVRMDVELSFVADDGLFLVEGELALRNDSQEELDRVDLAVRDAFVAEFEVFGDDVAHALAPARIGTARFSCLGAELARPIAPGAECVLRFVYGGELSSNQFIVAADFAYGSWVEAWYPVPLQQDGSRPARTPTVAGRTILHMPANWHGVTNGELEERVVDDSEAVESWTSERAVARSFACGPYEVEEFRFGDRRIAVHLLTPKPTSAKDQAEILGRALAAMEARFGPYPYPSYRIAEAPMKYGGWGAASEQGFIVAKPNFFEVEGGNLPLFAHEAAHGWWGNLVGQRGPGSILCSESLAQYGAVLAIEALEGPEAATEFLRFSRPGYIDIQCARGYFALAAQGNDMPLAQLGGGGWQHNLADAKGHWFFHMLRRRVGDEIFFATLRELIDTYSDRQLSLDELRDTFVANAQPDDDLERFLAQWLDRAGAPRLEVDWTHDEAARRTELVIRQVQKGEPYALRLDVALVGPDGDERVVQVAIDGERTFASFEGAAPVDVVLDPAHSLLIWKPEYE